MLLCFFLLLIFSTISGGPSYVVTGKPCSSWWLPDRSPFSSARPVLQLGWAAAKVTQPASDSLDSTQRSPGAAALSQMLSSSTVITSALAHALATGWHLIWWHAVPPKCILDHSLLAQANPRRPAVPPALRKRLQLSVFSHYLEAICFSGRGASTPAYIPPTTLTSIF